jgi:hypothetical protein
MDCLLFIAGGAEEIDFIPDYPCIHRLILDKEAEDTVQTGEQST